MKETMYLSCKFLETLVLVFKVELLSKNAWKIKESIREKRKKDM